MWTSLKVEAAQKKETSKKKICTIYMEVPEVSGCIGSKPFKKNNEKKKRVSR